ncbi:hypothetical protein ES288_A08G072900v1 [Gossypium darwinii]|uniref:Uncharacterized protein n=1 Tax=Gossypium darwinii TaxID=34276 RepID=A0A5D2FIL6_GOSDA|nr:hypothetical protein ES288_A08G072900v1 [Gossypium darwinii]
MGVFNAIFSPKDKKALVPLDLGYNGPSYTWQRGGTLVRLDRALANNVWVLAFLQYLVSHLPHIKSNHRPIMLNTRQDIRLVKGRPFRFLAGWMKHNNFLTFVKEKLNFARNMAVSLSSFTTCIKYWNKNVYGFLGSQK